MPIRRYKPEQIVTLLRQVEVEIANGKTTPLACKEAQITVQTYYRCKFFLSRDAHIPLVRRTSYELDRPRLSCAHGISLKDQSRTLRAQQWLLGCCGNWEVKF